MEVTTVFTDSDTEERSQDVIDPDLNRSDLDIGGSDLELTSLNNEDISEFSVETKLNEDYLTGEQCMETQQSVQALLDQEKGISISSYKFLCHPFSRAQTLLVVLLL